MKATPHLIAAATIIMATTSAQAASITQNYDIFMDGSSSQSGTFDLSSLGAGEYISSASITALFSDDGDLTFSHNNTTVWNQTYYQPIYSSWHFCNEGWSLCRTLLGANSENTRTSRDYYTDEIETATLSSGDESTTSSSSYYTSSQFKGTQTYSEPDGEGTAWYTTYLYDHESGYTGDFSATLSLSELLLQQLNDDLSISWMVAASVGDFIFRSVTLDYEVATLTTPSAIPVPAALPLFGTGLGLMGFLGWLRRRRANTVAA